jgi:hypothetical protein
VNPLRFGTPPPADGHDGFLRSERLCTRYNPPMAGAPSPERPVVLRRLGVIKDPNDPFLQESRALRESPQDALELFATEAESTPRVERWLNAIRPVAAWSIELVRRNPMVGVVAVSAVCLVVALWAINRLTVPDLASEPNEAPVPAAGDTSAATSNDAAGATTPTSTSQRPRAANANAARSTGGTIARGQQAVRSRGEEAPAGIARPAAIPPQPDRLDGFALAAAPDAPVAAPASTEAPAAVVDDTIYSEKDRDVVPPQTSEILPGPTFARWTTRTNAMEVIVSETGDVERVRLVTPPQRMPDMIVLSRAKVWKFKPAMKDGRPVRYRLLLTWEVNP